MSSARSNASSNLGKLLAIKATQKTMSVVAAKSIIAIKKHTPLKWVEMFHIEDNKFIWAKANYLYWACFRGHVNLIKYILEKDRISPFARVYEGRSPLMAALIGKHKINTVSNLTSSTTIDQLWVDKPDIAMVLLHLDSATSALDSPHF